MAVPCDGAAMRDAASCGMSITRSASPPVAWQARRAPGSTVEARSSMSSSDTRRLQALESFEHDDAAGRAGERAAAVVRHLDALLEQAVEEILVCREAQFNRG